MYIHKHKILCRKEMNGKKHVVYYENGINEKR